MLAKADLAGSGQHDRWGSIVVVALQVDPTVSVDRFFDHVPDRAEAVWTNALVGLRPAHCRYDVGPGWRVLGASGKTRPVESVADGMFAVDGHIFFKDLRGDRAGFGAFDFAEINVDTDHLGAQDG